MRLLTRSLAAGTVGTGVLLATVFSTFIAPGVIEAQQATAVELHAQRVLPAGWSTRVAEHLARDPIPIDRAELDEIVAAVQRCAGRFELDPLTVLAVIKVESGFDPFAVSPMGATGLMQLRPDTAREVATRLGLEWSSPDALFDPQTNVLLGTAYLRELLDRFDHLDVALAAFHAGPNRIASARLHLGPVALQYTDRVWDSIVEYHKTVRASSRIS